MKPTRRDLQLIEWRKRREHMARLRNDGRTLDEIGKQFKISRERVRQLLKQVNGVKETA